MACILVLRQFALPLAPVHCGLGYRAWPWTQAASSWSWTTSSTPSTSELEAALTEPTWEGRIITTSKWVTLKNRATWIATGNGLTFGEEMARRVYMIELESNLERPA